MTVKQRFRNKFTIQLRERDHGPAHVHLFGAGHDVTIELLTMKSDGKWPSGLKAEVLKWIASHRDELMEEWKQWHE